MYVYDKFSFRGMAHRFSDAKYYPYLTLNIPSLARQRCLSSWGPRRTPWFFL